MRLVYVVITILSALKSADGSPNRISVAPPKLESHRSSGSREIPPDDDTKKKVVADHKTYVTASFEICIDENGNVVDVRTLKASQYDDWDLKLTTVMKSDWKYKPYEIAGKAQPVCSSVSHMYKNPNAPARPSRSA